VRLPNVGFLKTGSFLLLQLAMCQHTALSAGCLVPRTGLRKERSSVVEYTVD